jgi:hypothetical protein
MLERHLGGFGLYVLCVLRALCAKTLVYDVYLRREPSYECITCDRIS